MPEIPIRSFAVSVVVLRRVVDRHEVLLLQRNETLVGEWCQIVGAIEAEETAWKAALRELAEETGLRPISFYSADICEQFYEPDKDAISILPVFVAYVTEDAAVTLNHEHSAFRWLSFEAAAALVPFSGQRDVLRHVEQEFADRDPNPHLRIDL